MNDLGSFVCYLQRLRTCDEQAAAELVRLYEPEIRREVRLRRLAALLDIPWPAGLALC
jgi:hypothetical protein